ncbi:MAG: hypothetical protein U0800_07695 [Isosphaeraceae bacterium]
MIFESNEWFEGIGHGRPAEDWPFGELPTIRFLREHRYRFYAIGRSYLQVNLQRIDAHSTSHPPVSDLLALHEGQVREIAPKLGLADG